MAKQRKLLITVTHKYEYSFPNDKEAKEWVQKQFSNTMGTAELTDETGKVLLNVGQNKVHK